jgi:hypothetical protein
MAAQPDQGFEPLFKVYDPPGFASYADTPLLQRTAVATFAPFQDWWDGAGSPSRRGSPGGVQHALIERMHAHGLLENEVVAEVERKLGGRARPFRLTIDFLAVTGADIWSVNEHRVMLALNLRDDTTAYRACLGSVVMRLASAS